MNEDLYIEQFRSAVKPEKRYSVSEWADEFRMLSTKASAEPGKWRTDRIPYAKEIMDCLSAYTYYERIVLMKAAQIGGTEIGNNWIGYIIHHAPAPTLCVQPTIPMARRNSKQRIEPLIEETPVLKAKIGEKMRGDSSNTLMEKDFPGGTLVLAGANSSAGLRSMPAKNVFFDEIDDYPKDLEGQGDPVALAKARARTFSKRKFFENSTPTVEGLSPIEASFEDSDKRFCHLPCPECGHYQKLEFKRLQWPEGEPKKAQYVCISCEYKISNWQKTTMLKKHKWIAEQPGHDGGKVAGFHLSSLYSPGGWYSWEEIAVDFVKAKKSPEKLKTFVNTVLGETWKEKTETPDWNRLYERRESYALNVIPKAVCFLTCGVDIQRDRIELEIVGWCREKVTYSIDYRVLRGDTAGKEVWNELAKVLGETFEKEDAQGLRMGIKLMAVDSGYNTQTVYDWVRKSSGKIRVVAIKGQDSLNLIHGLPKSADIKLNGKTIRRGLKVWPVGVSVIKSELYGWLRQPKAVDDEEDPFGYCHFPEYDGEFFKMLTAERLVEKYVRGYKRSEWEKFRERNEALDCRVYARAAAAICGIDRFSEDNWKVLENEFTHDTSVATQSKPKKKKRDSIW